MMLAPMIVLLISVTAFLAAAVNAVAGGGTFIAFPALTFFGGLSEKLANIGCTIGLWPGSASSVFAARKEIAELPRQMVIAYTALCLVGGTLGSLLLLHTSAKAFSLAIPWLLAFATTVFIFGKQISRWAGRTGNQAHSSRWTLFVGIVQFVISIYGGYFGAGIGVLTLAGLSLTGIGDLKQVNSLKVLLSTATNFSAAVVFLFGPVPWGYVLPMAAASTIGGLVGMMGARRLPQSALRAIICSIAISLTLAYFWKTYFSR